MSARMTVPLKNFHVTEAQCQCGCGKDTEPELMLRLQAFIYVLERVFDASVRCHITGPARCTRRQNAVYNKEGVQSYHCGMSRVHTPGSLGAAVDVVIEIFKNGEWVVVAKDRIAQEAINSKLFGGVIWKIYGPLHNFVHLDLGPIRQL